MMIIWFIILIFLFYSIGVSWKDPQKYPKEFLIPKKIWSYWNDESPPNIIQQCVKSWQKLNPDFEINFLTPNMIMNHINYRLPNNFQNYNPARQADWLRLYLITKFGGIWLDASVILLRPLSTWVFDFADSKGLGLYWERASNDYPHIENWFIAAPPGSSFVKQWFEEFDFACDQFNGNGDEYIQHLEKNVSKEHFNKIIEHKDPYNYLTAYIACQKIMRIDNIIPYKLLRAEDYGYFYYEKYKTDDEYVKHLTEDKDDSILHQQKIIKLTGGARSLLISHTIEKRYINPDSIFARLFS